MDYEIKLYKRTERNSIAKAFKATVSWTRLTPSRRGSDGEMLPISQYKDFYGDSKRKLLKEARGFIADREDTGPLWVEIPVDG